MARNNNYLCLVGWFIVIVNLGKGVSAKLYVVGDQSGWIIPTSHDFYSEWAKSKTFHIGDQLSFNWAIGTHGVTNVTKFEHERCVKSTKHDLSITSHVVVNLTFTGTHYFICTVRTHCEHGQKLTIDVTSTSSSTPGTLPSSTSLAVTISLFATLSAIFTSFITSNS
ncbi:hypothetical protein UlMin_003036 [Ulmus minor]